MNPRPDPPEVYDAITHGAWKALHEWGMDNPAIMKPAAFVVTHEQEAILAVNSDPVMGPYQRSGNSGDPGYLFGILTLRTSEEWECPSNMIDLRIYGHGEEGEKKNGKHERKNHDTSE